MARAGAVADTPAQRIVDGAPGMDTVRRIAPDRAGAWRRINLGEDTMKLLRYGPAGQESPGLLDDDGHIRDLSQHVPDIDGNMLGADRLRALSKLDTSELPIVEGAPRLGPPVANPGKILGIGLSYADHAAEAGMDLPEEPIVFSKVPTALSGPNDPVMIPRGSEKTDWEVELAFVIGRQALYVEKDEALDYVAGYAVMNDVSERAYQLEGSGQFIKGKSFDTFAPMGPWLVTTDEVPSPMNLKLWLDRNGKRRQDSSTSNMVFAIDYLVSYLSGFMTLMPGDIITTGTPPGVGMGCKPPEFLEPGDVMSLGVEGLGEQKQDVVAWSAGG
jgi:2-keto-4-pentenoate hydratase/2-oxohepta-3-ene-1,7-dioic acid hydratase in catechol pathway